MAKQPHTEEAIRHTDDQQDTGNHKRPGDAEAGGADRYGGTRAGAENVEHAAGPSGGTADSGDVERPGGTGQGANSVERIVETEEEGHLQERATGNGDRDRP